jgi:hypothetical protein
MAMSFYVTKMSLPPTDAAVVMETYEVTKDVFYANRYIPCDV